MFGFSPPIIAIILRVFVDTELEEGFDMYLVLKRGKRGRSCLVYLLAVCTTLSDAASKLQQWTWNHDS